MPRHALLGPYENDRCTYTRRRIRKIQGRCGARARDATQSADVHANLVRLRLCATEVETARDPYSACESYWRLVDIADSTVDAICALPQDVTRVELKRNRTLDILNAIAAYGDGKVGASKEALRAALVRAGVGVRRPPGTACHRQ